MLAVGVQILWFSMLLSFEEELCIILYCTVHGLTLRLSLLLYYEVYYYYLGRGHYCHSIHVLSKVLTILFLWGSFPLPVLYNTKRFPIQSTRNFYERNFLEFLQSVESVL